MTNNDKAAHINNILSNLEKYIDERSSGSRHVSIIVIVLTSFVAFGLLILYSVFSNGGEGPFVDFLLNLGTETLGAITIAIFTIGRLSFKDFSKTKVRGFVILALTFLVLSTIGIAIVFYFTNEARNLALTTNLVTELLGTIGGVLILEAAINQIKEENKETALLSISELKRIINDLQSQ